MSASIWKTIEDWIESNPGTGSATQLERLVLSLWSRHYSYSLCAICWPLDEVRLGWVAEAVSAYTIYGESDRGFMRLAQEISDRYEADGRGGD